VKRSGVSCARRIGRRVLPELTSSGRSRTRACSASTRRWRRRRDPRGWSPIAPGSRGSPTSSSSKLIAAQDSASGSSTPSWLIPLTAVRFVLGTADAHGLYERFGFEPVDPGRIMGRKSRAHGAVGNAFASQRQPRRWRSLEVRQLRLPAGIGAERPQRTPGAFAGRSSGQASLALRGTQDRKLVQSRGCSPAVPAGYRFRRRCLQLRGVDRRLIDDCACWLDVAAVPPAIVPAPLSGHVRALASANSAATIRSPSCPPNAKRPS
jgi:hypothetical protein